MFKRLTRIKTKEDLQVFLLFMLIVFVLFVKAYMVIAQPRQNYTSQHQSSVNGNQINVALPGSGANTSMLK